MAMFIVKPWYRKKDDAIYGAEWAGGSDPSWVRTDAAVGFSNPNPYYSGMSTTPSSPFDNIMPWSGIRRVTDASAGELVEIPKFYYKWTRDGVKMKLQISMSQFDGSYVSPAHADRGDGVGERDYVYVGRYHCSSGSYKSISGSAAKVDMTRATARNGVHNLGSNIWQWDFAMWWTINMLYLVEFAHWNSQSKIGYGCGGGGTNGGTDAMSYHTGTILTSRTTYGTGIQYRHIENMWALCMDWCDGIYFNGLNVYCIKNPANFSDSTGGVLVGQRPNTAGYIKSWSNPSVTNFEYALCPISVDSTLDGSSYITDYYGYNGNSDVAMYTSGYVNKQYYGAFMCSFDASSTAYYSGISTRLMVLPSSRLSA